jgi:hypothetical protein
MQMGHAETMMLFLIYGQWPPDLGVDADCWMAFKAG